MYSTLKYQLFCEDEVLNKCASSVLYSFKHPRGLHLRTEKRKQKIRYIHTKYVLSLFQIQNKIKRITNES